MKKTYCEECGAMRAYTVSEPAIEDLVIDGYQVQALQKHAFCCECGGEVYPEEATDFCVDEAHAAYRIACGSIPIKRIQQLLDRYNIAASALSSLLGWGRNTISRQMKHCVPDREHARKLESLFDVRTMDALLESRKDTITGVAYRKAKERVTALMREEESVSFDGLSVLIGNGQDDNMWHDAQRCVFDGTLSVVLEASGNCPLPCVFGQGSDDDLRNAA